jgi:hypothetical protein
MAAGWLGRDEHPALIQDDRLVLQGRVPTVAALTHLLTTASH